MQQENKITRNKQKKINRTIKKNKKMQFENKKIKSNNRIKYTLK